VRAKQEHGDPTRKEKEELCGGNKTLTIIDNCD